MDKWILDSEQIEYEKWLSKLSQTEKECVALRDNRIRHLDDPQYDNDYYEDALDCLLFWAVEDGKITAEESERLYRKYA